MKAVSRANVEHVLSVSFGIAVRLLIRWQNWLAGAALVFLVLVGIRLWPHQPLRAWKPTSLAITDARGRLLRLVLASDDRYRLWLPLSQMPPELVQAALMREDRWFYWRSGRRSAMALTARRRRAPMCLHSSRQGGSTITMQLARLLY